MFKNFSDRAEDVAYLYEWYTSNVNSLSMSKTRNATCIVIMHVFDDSQFAMSLCTMDEYSRKYITQINRDYNIINVFFTKICRKEHLMSIWISQDIKKESLIACN